jgi:RNA polymerase sigma-B factor
MGTPDACTTPVVSPLSTCNLTWLNSRPGSAAVSTVRRDVATPVRTPTMTTSVTNRKHVPIRRSATAGQTRPGGSGQPHTASAKTPVDARAMRLLHTLAALPAEDPDRVALRERTIEAWLPLAKHLAQRFHGRGEPLDDLTQIATVGLIKAIDRFDPEYGNDFAAYAVPTIVGEIKRHFRDRTWDIRVPRRLQELKLDINEATATLAQQLGRSPTITDIATYLKRPEEDIIEGLEGARAYSAISLQTLVGSGIDGTELGDLFGAEDTDLALAEFRASLGPALDTLPPREQKIVILRFFGNLTQTQIASHIGISQMHVSRLLTKSLATLRTQFTEV